LKKRAHDTHHILGKLSKNPFPSVIPVNTNDDAKLLCIFYTYTPISLFKLNHTLYSEKKLQMQQL